MEGELAIVTQPCKTESELISGDKRTSSPLIKLCVEEAQQVLQQSNVTTRLQNHDD